MQSASCVQFENVAHAAYLIDQKFDLKNVISFGNENDMRARYGDTFYEEFFEYFSNSWYHVLNEAIMDFDFAEVFSMAVRKAVKTAKVNLVDTGDWDGEEMEG